MIAPLFHLHLFVAAVLMLGNAAASAEIRLTDDSGRTVTLKEPARRIITLAPHIVELLFAAGAGERIVGAVEYSNYPEAAKRIPRIGDSALLDLERIVALKPDLIVVWQHGNAQRQLDKLLSLGIPAYYNQPNRLPDIAHSIENFGRLAGTEAIALTIAQAFTAREAQLRARYTGRAPVSVFYQISENPLMTINGEHIVSDLIRMCGGQNVFAGLKPLVPVISNEAVLMANPEAIAGATSEVNTRGNLDNWKRWPRLRAAARDNLFVIHTELISRYGPRILDGAQQICEHLDAARAKRK